MRLIQKLLIVNRGEIARRINRSAQNMGIHTVALWIESDRHLQYHRETNEAEFLEGDSIEETFLNIDRILDIAQKKGCDAIHPGYGFLSESPEFARRCIEAGLVWIGPSPESMELLSNKVEATKIAVSQDIPTIPTVTGELKELTVQCENMDFPLLIKAASGGGGRGMKIVRSKEELGRQLEAAAFEAQSYFGNAQLFVTPYFEQVRHVEVQIVADKWGNVVHLYDRECSIQRRYQKIVEEAPCVSIDPNVREKILADAVKLAKKAGYDNVGTVEFIVLPSGKYYFLEVNTRIQVEHPVTELITGIDIVACQIRSAQGEKLPWKQENIQPRGHAIECRLCAEDPANAFLPSGGTIKVFDVPKKSYLRVEADVKNEQEINLNFDSLLAKIVVQGNDRAQTLQRMSQTLDQFIVLGTITNLPLLRALFSYPDFQQNNVYTTFLELHLNELLSKIFQNQQLGYTETVLLATAAFIHQEHCLKHHTSYYSQWYGRWRLFPYLRLRIDETENIVQYQYNPANNLIHIKGNEGNFEVRFIGQPVQNHSFAVEVTTNDNASVNQTYEIYYAIDSAGHIYLESNGKKAEADILARYLDTREHRWLKPQATKQNVSDANRIVAPIPGKIVKIFITAGQRIKHGDLLAIIESMKTENKLTALSEGIVEEIFVRTGETVKANQTLFTIGKN
ncbi:MAG: biotin carboxylase N-terminal domain-containing protein [Bacteroidales bacterium]